MDTSTNASSSFSNFSDAIADAVERIAPSVVQVAGRRRPASGLVWAPQVVVASARTLGRGDGLRVGHGSTGYDAQLAGWDPSTGLAVLRVNGLEAPPVQPSERPARVGHFAVAVARSWSNAVTASTGTVAVIGGPLTTGRRRSIEEIIRTTAPMHEGFAGGAFADTTGRLLGVCTAGAIRGLGVVIPERIVRAAATSILEHGAMRRGYLGLAGQTVSLGDAQRQEGRTEALLVVGVTAGSPAAQAGILVGDLMLDFDGHAVHSGDELLDRLGSDRVGQHVAVRVLRGTSVHSLTVTVGERPVA